MMWYGYFSHAFFYCLNVVKTLQYKNNEGL